MSDILKIQNSRNYVKELLLIGAITSVRNNGVSLKSEVSARRELTVVIIFVICVVTAYLQMKTAFFLIIS